MTDLKDKLTALLAEYSTLRAEVIDARSNTGKAIGIGIPFAAGLYFQSFPTLGSVVVCVVAGFAIWNDQNTRAFCIRLRALEQQINEMQDERLLIWETDHGWGSIFPPPGNKHFKGPPKVDEV